MRRSIAPKRSPRHPSQIRRQVEFLTHVPFTEIKAEKDAPVPSEIAPGLQLASIIVKNSLDLGMQFFSIVHNDSYLRWLV